MVGLCPRPLGKTYRGWGSARAEGTSRAVEPKHEQEQATISGREGHDLSQHASRPVYLSPRTHRLRTANDIHAGAPLTPATTSPRITSDIHPRLVPSLRFPWISYQLNSALSHPDLRPPQQTPRAIARIASPPAGSSSRPSWCTRQTAPRSRPPHTPRRAPSGCTR